MVILLAERPVSRAGCCTELGFAAGAKDMPSSGNDAINWDAARMGFFWSCGRGGHVEEE